MTRNRASSLRLRGRFEVEALEARLVLSVSPSQLAALPHVPSQVLVQYQPGASDAALSALRGRVQAASVADASTPLARAQGQGRLELINLPATASIAATIRALEADPAVAFAEPNWIHHHDATSNDTYYTSGQLWGMYGDATTPANQFGSQAGEAWAGGQTGSNTVYVGVIDEGIMKTHEDLAQNIWINGQDPVNGVDDDGNGYVDDTNGWDFYGNDNSIYDGTGDDHGTHVSGTIGARGGNGKGVAGVNWSVTLISAKFLGPNGGSTADAIEAIDYITNLKLNKGLNIVATNNSWGGGGFSQALKDAITRAGNAGILFIASAGNSAINNDTNPQYPASYDNANIISVASITKTGGLSSFSNYGATSVDIGAPGSSIISTVPGRRNKSAYASYSGTSMAAPHVTGAAALYAAANPGSTASQIKTAILNSAVATTSLSGKTVTGGRLNVSAMLGVAPTGRPAPSEILANSSVQDLSLAALADFDITATLLGSGKAKKGLATSIHRA